MIAAVSRRAFIAGSIYIVANSAIGQTLSEPFYITIKREFPNGPLQLNSCVYGRLFLGSQYYHQPQNILAGEKGLCNTLELPWRNNFNDISCCPEGSYTGRIRTDPSTDGRKLGWRIELNDVEARKNIQIHVGNSEGNTVGCILPGIKSAPPSSKGLVQGPKCWVSSSGPTIQAIKLMYGGNNNRPIGIKVL